MSELFQSGQHPDADQLSAFAEQALPAHEQQQMLAHMANCAMCREIAYLAEEAALEELPAEHPAAAPTPPASKPWIPRWFSGWNLAWPVGAAIACLIVLAVQLHLSTVRKSKETTTSIASNSNPPRVAPAVPQTMPEQQPIKPKGNASLGPSMRAPTRPETDVTTEPVTNSLSPETVDSATLTGRDAAELVRMMPAPATSAESSVAATKPAPSMNGAAASSPAGTAIAGVSGAEAQVPMDTAEISATLNNEMVGSAASSFRLAKLPSHLAAVSTVTNGRIALAIDSAGALFASKNGGKHWKAVSPQWAGRPVRVAFVAARQLEAHVPVAAEYDRAATVPQIPATAITSPAPKAGPLLESQNAIPTENSTVSGVVTDQTGARIADAKVTLTRVDSGDQRDLRTDRNGSYAFGQLVPGKYALEVVAPGFQPWRETELEVSVSQPTIAVAKLNVGAESAAVTVVSNAPAIETESSTVSARIKEDPATASPALFQLTTDTGAAWTSSDGRHWKRK
jgi:hypothetical protein